jgi:hypothetical protein
MVDRCLVPFSKSSCVLSTVVALVVGCAGQIPAASTDERPPDAEGGGPLEAEEMPPLEPLAPGEWQSLSFDARKQFMREVVMPTMRPLFVEADAERFERFSCSSCHGQGAGDGTFAMPSSDLPALGGPPTAMDDERKQRVVEFMRTSVKPKMAELLGESELRCSTCHPSAS